MTGPQPQHDDPVGETRAQLAQALAVMSTVGEAAARWAAVGVQTRASRREQSDRAAQAAAATRERADQLARQAAVEQDKAVRQHIAQAFDEAWLDQADLTATARLWRAATLRAATGDALAREAMGRAEQRLRSLRPNLMQFYDRFRSEGRPPADAMRAAAQATWLHADNTNLGPQARPHPGRQPVGLRAGANGRALGEGGRALEDLDAAVRREATALADGVDPEVLDRLQRQWRSAGLVPPAEAAELLAQYARELRGEVGIPAVVADRLTATASTAAAGEAAEAAHLAGYAAQQRGEATVVAGTTDVAATVVDEHDAGLVTAGVVHGRADEDAARAAQQRRMAQTFPQLTVVQATVPHLLDKRPAPIVATRQRGRAR